MVFWWLASESMRLPLKPLLLEQVYLARETFYGSIIHSAYLVFYLRDLSGNLKSCTCRETDMFRCKSMSKWSSARNILEILLPTADSEQ